MSSQKLTYVHTFKNQIIPKYIYIEYWILIHEAFIKIFFTAVTTTKLEVDTTFKLIGNHCSNILYSIYESNLGRGKFNTNASSDVLREANMDMLPDLGRKESWKYLLD